MFNVFSLKNSTPLTAEERRWLLRLLDGYEDCTSGQFLREFPWSICDFRWCHSMTPDNGVMGCFSPIHPDTLYLMPQNASIKPVDGRVYWLEEIFPTVIHELRHAWQFRENPVGYVLCSLPLIRQLTLERDAVREQEKARLFSEKWIRSQDRLFAEKHGLDR